MPRDADKVTVFDDAGKDALVVGVVEVTPQVRVVFRLFATFGTFPGGAAQRMVLTKVLAKRFTGEDRRYPISIVVEMYKS